MANVSSSNGIEKYPKLRFPEFSEPWSHVKLSDFAERIMRKNKNNETDLPLTISSKDGLVDQISFFNKTVASKDMSGYYLLMNGEYAYNKSYSVGYDFGSIKRLDRYPMGALSTLYICFALKKHNSDFIKTYFDSLKWYKEIYMISAEGARNHGLLNVPTDEFFDTYHYITENTKEQEKIAQLMALIEQRIQKQQALVDNLKKYKRGLIKDIFTGKLSLSAEVPFSSWEARTIKDCLLYEQPQKYIVETEKYDNTYTTPVLTANKAFILGYTNEQQGIYDKGDVIIYDDFTMDMKYVTFNFKVKSSTIKMLTPTLGNDLYFMYALLQSLDLQPEGHQRSYISKVEMMSVKIPPYNVQLEISNFLKKFDARVVLAEQQLEHLVKQQQGFLQALFV